MRDPQRKHYYLLVEGQCQNQAYQALPLESLSRCLHNEMAHVGIHIARLQGRGNVVGTSSG